MNRILLFRDRREENLKIFEIIEFSLQNCVDPSSHIVEYASLTR